MLLVLNRLVRLERQGLQLYGVPRCYTTRLVGRLIIPLSTTPSLPRYLDFSMKKYTYPVFSFHV